MDLFEGILPPFAIQVAAFFAIAIGGAFMWVRGKNTKSESDFSKEREELREQIAAAVLRDAAQKIRDDVGVVLEANRSAFFKALNEQDDRNRERIHNLGDRLREIEIDQAGVKRDVAHLMLGRRLPGASK